MLPKEPILTRAQLDELRKVDITGIDKAVLLVALYEGAAVLGLGALDRNAGRRLTVEEAKAILEKHFRIDYLWGRPIKVDLSKDLVDPALYDRDAGEGAFARIVDELKQA